MYTKHFTQYPSENVCGIKLSCIRYGSQVRRETFATAEFLIENKGDQPLTSVHYRALMQKDGKDSCAFVANNIHGSLLVDSYRFVKISIHIPNDLPTGKYTLVFDVNNPSCTMTLPVKVHEKKEAEKTKLCAYIS
jgi:hypothetical protein